MRKHKSNQTDFVTIPTDKEVLAFYPGTMPGMFHHLKQQIKKGAYPKRLSMYTSDYDYALDTAGNDKIILFTWYTRFIITRDHIEIIGNIYHLKNTHVTVKASR